VLERAAIAGPKEVRDALRAMMTEVGKPLAA
jgi:hypothetical protein